MTKVSEGLLKQVFWHLFSLIGNSFGISLLKKTLREDAQLAEEKFELCSHSRAKESQATLCYIIYDKEGDIL